MFISGQVNQTDQSVAFTKKRQGALLVQSDSSGRTTRRTTPHTRQKHWLSQSHPSVGISSDGLSSDGSSFRQNRRLSQSRPSVGLSSDGLSSDGSSFGKIVGSANHIHRLDYLRTDFLRTDHPSDESSAQPITSFGRIIFGRTFFVTNQKPTRY